MSNSLEAVLWDMDGTLIDSEHYWMAAEQQLAATTGEVWTEQDGLSLIGMSLYDSSRLLKQKLNLQMDSEQIIKFLTDAVVSRLELEIPWRPGALELLRELRANGVKTALVTMSMRRMALAVAENTGFDAFDLVVAGDDVSKGKPDPEPYLVAAKGLEVNISNCVAFEDSISGLHSAESSGAVAIGIPNLVNLPQRSDRILWPTLAGVRLTDLTGLLNNRGKRE